MKTKSYIDFIGPRIQFPNDCGIPPHWASITQQLGDVKKENWIRYVVREHNYPLRPWIVGEFETREEALKAYPHGTIFALGMYW